RTVILQKGSAFDMLMFERFVRKQKIMSHRHYQELTWSNDEYRGLQKDYERMSKLKDKWHTRAKEAEKDLDAVVQWLVNAGFPFDWTMDRAWCPDSVMVGVCKEWAKRDKEDVLDIAWAIKMETGFDISDKVVDDG
ncbi:MAG: hypothetical protein NWE76_01960, partial [Candidatus Bathyarchaeota archaeon]|nr:hypothetical protein [Candidatus Bathyarchaeota archaeon]